MARTALFSRKQAGGVFTIADIEKHPGEVYFVHSGIGSNAAGSGNNPDAPFASLAYAFSSDVLVAGDKVYLLPGHNESIGDAQVTLDIAGVSIEGLGQGSNTPRFDFDHANASIDVAASGISIKHIRLLPSVTAVLIGIDINTLALDTLIEDVEVLPGEDGAGVDEFAVGVDIKVGCSRTVVRGVKVRQHASAAGVVAGVQMNGASDDITIDDCDIVCLGAAVTAPITGVTTLSTNVRIRRNILVSDDEPGIDCVGIATSGVIKDNLIFSNLATIAAAIVATGCALDNNRYIEVAPESGVIIGTASVDD
jgi:hypothetical protein